MDIHYQLGQRAAFEKLGVSAKWINKMTSSGLAEAPMSRVKSFNKDMRKGFLRTADRSASGMVNIPNPRSGLKPTKSPRGSIGNKYERAMLLGKNEEISRPANWRYLKPGRVPPRKKHWSDT